MDQPGTAASPARGQLNRENEYSLSSFAPEKLVSRDGFGRSAPRQPAHSPYILRQAEYGAYRYSRDSSRFSRWRPSIYLYLISGSCFHIFGG